MEMEGLKYFLVRGLLLIFVISLLSYAEEESGGTFFPFHQGEVKEGETEESGLDFFAMIPAAPKELEITNDIDKGVTEGDFQKQELTYKNKVVIKADSGLQIYADEARISLLEKKVTARGNVSVYNGPYLFKGDQVVYYYEEKRLDTTSLRTGADPFLIQARSMRNVERDGQQVLIAEGAAVTTDDYENPSYWLKAEQFSIYPDSTAVLRKLKLEIGGVTVLKLPYLAQSLDENLGYHFTPGGQNNLGFFWKNRYGLHLGGEKDEETGRVNNPDYLMQYYLDPYTKRGVGLGVDLYDLEYEEAPELGNYSLYYIYDMNPEIKRSQISRDGLVNHGRYMAKVNDRRDWGEVYGGDLRLDTNVTLLSDAFFLEDYFEDDYRKVPQPDNIVSLSHAREQSLLTLSARFPLNRFYETDTRLPELSYDQIRSPLFGTGLFYEGYSSAGYLREELSEFEEEALRSEAETASTTRFDEIQALLNNRGFFRAHTWHELSYPLQTGFGLSITPRAGAGYTYYNNKGEDEGRFLSNLGIDLSLKLSKSFPELKNRDWGLDGLNHIIQPYVNLSLVEVSNLENNLIPVDRLTPITRPRPVNVGRYVGIDVLDDQSLARTGVRQTFLTRRDGRNHQWLYWDTYLDILLGEQDAVNSLSNLYNEISWSPLPWLELNMEAQFPVVDTPNEFVEYSLGADFLIGRSTSVELSYSLLENHPILEDSNSLRYELYHRFNEEWGAGMEHRWQFDDSTLEYQRYALHRTLKSWILSTELYRRDFRVDEEWGFTIGFTLRNFPQISLPVSIEQ